MSYVAFLAKVYLCIFSDCKEKEVSEEANDEKIAKRLWLISEKWTKIT